MKQYKTFFDRILGELDKLSVNHAEAYRYWIRRGNLVNVDSESDSYPNVTLTCRNPLFEDGKFMNYSISNNYFLLYFSVGKNFGFNYIVRYLRAC